MRTLVERPKDDAEVLKLALDWFDEDMEYESDMRDLMDCDVAFEAGIPDYHWDSKLSKQREIDRRPCLIVPRSNQFLNQVRNEQRQNKPTIKVSGREDDDVKAADTRQGIIRHIQYDSSAVDAYQCAFDHAVGPGRGWFLIKTDYVSDSTFDQKIIIEQIRQANRVVPDRMRKEFDYSDMQHCFVTDRTKRDDFKVSYPDANAINWESTDTDKYWQNSDDIQLAELYVVWGKKRTLLLFDDGSSGFKDEMNAEILKENEARIKDEREVMEPYIEWMRLTQQEILEKTDIPGKWIPLIPVIGKEMIVGGKLVIKGMTRDLQDIQKMYNFWTSYEAEIISYAPKAPYIAAAGQIKDYKQYWKNANTTAHAVLPYKPMETGGKLVPPPQRVPFPEVPMAAIQAKMGCIDDMKAVTGIYDPSLGNVSGEKSGRAILARQRQSDNANYNYVDNLRIAITHAGRIINDWLPIYYPPGTVARIMGNDQEEDEVKIGGMGKNGKPVSIGDSDADYDVTVTMGAAFDTKRQEGTEAILDLLKVVPQVAPLIYDIFVKNMDFPGAQDIADRLRKTIPPEIMDVEGGEQKIAQKLQQAMQKIQQDGQMIQAMQQQLQQMSQEMEAKGIETKGKMAIADMNNRAKIQIAGINAMADDNRQAAEMTKFFLGMNNVATPQA